MSDTNQKTPTHIAYAVTKDKNGKAFYHNIGASFPHSKGGGFTVKCAAIPVDGMIVCFPPKEKPEGEQEPKAE